MKIIKIKHSNDLYFFTIDEKDFAMFMHCFNISYHPYHLKRNLEYYNIKYEVREILQWKILFI